MSASAIRDDDLGITDSASPVMRFLWWCAGGDRQLLERCPNSDRVKMQGLGGMVLATGMLAFLSGSYAFYTVFAPKVATTLSPEQDFTHWPSVVQAVLFGVLWALIIFNIDRFIVGSTGKGDGTDAITWGELGRALPRIAMATVIGVTLAAPLEIRILESEIRAELDKAQAEHLDALNAPLLRDAGARKAELEQRKDEAEQSIAAIRAEIEKRRLEIVRQREEIQREAEGLSRSGRAGRGPAWRDKQEALAAFERDFEPFKAAREAEIAKLQDSVGTVDGEIVELEQNVARRIEQHQIQASHKDGLMERIRLAHQIGGWVPYWITALLLCIELGPIFFKMMLVKGAYDYLEEDRKQLIAARAGIQTDVARILTGEGNKTRHVDIHHAAEAVLAEERRRFETEDILSTKVHEEFRRRTEADIVKNLDNYLEPPPEKT